MKTFFRWTIRIGVTLFCLVIVLLVVAVLLKDVIAKSLAERNLRDNTGMDAKISKLEVGLGTPTINLEGLKLYNTPEFGGGTFLDLPELRIEYEPAEIRNGKLHFKTVRLSLSEVNVVKSKNGKTNIEMLDKEVKKRSARQKKNKSDKLDVEFGGIDRLYLTIGRIRVTDEGDSRNNEVINLGIKDEVLKDIKTEAQLTEQFGAVLMRMALREAWTTKASPERTQRLLRLLGVRL